MFSITTHLCTGASQDIVIPRFRSEPTSYERNLPIVAPFSLACPQGPSTIAPQEHEAQHISLLEASEGAENAELAAVAGSDLALVDEPVVADSCGARARPALAMPEAIPALPLGNPQAAPEAGEDEIRAPDTRAAAAAFEGVPDIEPGDFVVLGPGAPPEHRRSPAVVTKVSEAHCTVVVLDESLRFGVGECWPMFEDVLPVQSRAWREGTPVAIDGLRGGKVRKLNGFAGTVVAHPREGHPSFIERPPKPKSDDSEGGPQLVLCVRLEDPVAAGQKTVLLEPRFLVPRGQCTRSVAAELHACHRHLRGRHNSCPATGERASDEALGTPVAGPAC